MGFMKAWEAWSIKQYDNWGSKLSKRYTSVKNWKTPDWAKELFEKVWEELDSELKKKLYKLIYETCKNFDKAFAEALLKKIVEILIASVKK